MFLFGYIKASHLKFLKAGAMKIKHILLIFLLGVILITAGAFFKVLHWPGANVMLGLAAVLQVLAGILAIWKVLTLKRFKEFINS